MFTDLLTLVTTTEVEGADLILDTGLKTGGATFGPGTRAFAFSPTYVNGLNVDWVLPPDSIVPSGLFG